MPPAKRCAYATAGTVSFRFEGLNEVPKLVLGFLRPKRRQRRQDELFGCPPTSEMYANVLVVSPVIKSIIEIMKILHGFMR